MCGARAEEWGWAIPPLVRAWGGIDFGHLPHETVCGGVLGNIGSPSTSISCVELFQAELTEAIHIFFFFLLTWEKLLLKAAVIPAAS